MFGLILKMLGYVFCARGLNAVFAMLCVAGAFGVDAMVLWVASAVLYGVLAIVG